MREEITRRIQAAMPDAEVSLDDLTGSGDHWQAVVISSTFEGRTRVARQRAVFAALGDLMSGPVHALTFRALTPTEAHGDPNP